LNFEHITIETQKLTLRQLVSEDATDIFSIYSDKTGMKYWSSLPFTQSQQATDLINNVTNWWQAGSSLCLGLEHKENQKIIGTISLFSFNEESRRAEIGYILSSAYWQGGIMTEALKGVLEFVFKDLNLNRLEADIDPDNLASAKLLQKLGFQLEGRLRQRWIINGNITDSELYGLLSEDYQQAV